MAIPKTPSAAEDEALARVRETGFLLRLPPQLREAVLEGADLVAYPAGGVAVYRDERWRPALVAWGLVRSYLARVDDRQLTLVYHRLGDLVEVFRARGEMVSDGIQAIEPSGVLHLDGNRLERLAKTHEELAIALAEELRDRLAHAYRALAFQAFAPLRQRVAADLLERTGWVVDQSGEGVRVSAQELAEATGSVREVVARALRQLRRDGVIGVERNRVVVLDPARLRREATALS